MDKFQIIAHRGARGNFPENTLPAFEEAISKGADAIELDVRLTADHQPAVFHYFYLRPFIDMPGAIFDYSLEALQSLSMRNPDGSTVPNCRISSLHQVLQALAGRIALEIEIKGPEPECVDAIAGALLPFHAYWDTIELTSYEPALLQAMHRLCPSIPTDLLIPRSESWMGLDVVAYSAAQRGRLAGARAVHLHPSQLMPQVVDTVHKAGMAIHAWDVNKEEDLLHTLEMGITRVCTDRLEWAITYRDNRN